MTTVEQIAAFPAELGWWRERLKTYTPDQLTAGASDDDWSIGQIYVHLAQSALRFHLPSAERALESTEQGGEPTEIGWQMIRGGEMPPVKVPPSPQYTPQQTADAAAIATLLDQVEAGYAALAGRVLANPSASGTNPHMRLGQLTAAQWLTLVTNHYRGHRRQLQRREARLAVVHG